jgi:dinuclear metal center YbgI/SA1388 family protein
VIVDKVDASEIVDYLNEYLGVDNVPDYPNAHNGLQVENSGGVRLVAACTDACQATIDAAAKIGADMMIVHHGLFWDAGITPLTGRAYRRVKKLLDHDIAVYSSHLPLDAHPEVGNNAELARGIGLTSVERFGEFQGSLIGFMGELNESRDALSERIRKLLGSQPLLIPGGPNQVRRVGVVTGGAAQLIPQARAAGLDTFITGEGGHHSVFDALELEINVFYGGHYATETLGVRALASHVAEKFGVDWEFIDNPTGL